MKVVEYLVDFLKKNKVTDVFGIPGGVVLDFLYELDKQEGIVPHLSYHEQAAAFEAIGYAQVNHTLGVAYATRGPGFTNLITGIAEAFAESIPVMFIVGHSGMTPGHSKRFEKDQEMDTVQMVKHITKYAVSIDHANQFKSCLSDAYVEAMTGRKGPVLLDISSAIWSSETDITNPLTIEEKNVGDCNLPNAIYAHLENSKRPIILIGDGINQTGEALRFVELLNNSGIPILSSRGSQNVGSKCLNYFGYIGSHGIRYSNAIFYISDYVLTLGNRLSFPHQSKTFSGAIENKLIDYIDIDSDEFTNNISNLQNYLLDLKHLNVDERFQRNCNCWIEKCINLKNLLWNGDINDIVEQVSTEFKRITKDYTIVCDVGNNEFWASRAYEHSKITNDILYSKSFGSLGCAIAKAIGVHYKTLRPVLCIIGDQGFQLNIQELQMIGTYSLPIKILVLNNKSSGMICDREKNRFGSLLHVTADSGYHSCDLQKASDLYSLEYCTEINYKSYKPQIKQIEFEDTLMLSPSIPMGNQMYDMAPAIEESISRQLERIINE